VGALEDLQDVARRALHAERDPVEATRDQLVQRRRVHAVRIRLDTDLGVRGQAELVPYRAQHDPELTGRQQRRRAAADEHGRHRRERPRGREHPRGEADLGRGHLGITVT